MVLPLVIIGGFVYWFGYSLPFYFLNYFLIFFILVIFYVFFFFLFFFISPFLLSRVADRVLMLQLGVRPEPEVGEPRSGLWSTRDLPASRNINQRELSQRSPSQH